ncbi:hypothetical protein [Streptomyces sp. NPDC059010]
MSGVARHARIVCGGEVGAGGGPAGCRPATSWPATAPSRAP